MCTRFSTKWKVILTPAKPAPSSSNLPKCSIPAIFDKKSPIPSMQITFATPALLFPAISLLLLAYTNKFLAIANLIRNLHERYQKDSQPVLREQIVHLRKRLNLIRLMQTFGIASFLMCFVCMFLLFWEKQGAATWAFVVALLMMMASLALSLGEIWISAGALRLLLKDFEKEGGKDGEAVR